MNRKKGAIGLSLNFIVIIVISIAVLILSFAFVRKIYTGATNTQETYYQQFEKQMESLACDSSDRVCVGKNRKQIDSNGVAVFTMRILNMLGSDKTFIVGVSCDNTVFSNCGNSPSYSLASSYLISNNEAQSFIIAFNGNGKLSGTYVYNVEISSPTEYSTEKQKLYVVVP